MLRRTDVSLRIGRLDSITCNVHARISRDCSPVLHGGLSNCIQLRNTVTLSGLHFFDPCGHNG